MPRRVVEWVKCPGIISAVRVAPDCGLASVGLGDGRIMLYRTSNLRYHAQARFEGKDA